MESVRTVFGVPISTIPNGTADRRQVSLDPLFTGCYCKSGRQDLNLRPLDPQSRFWGTPKSLIFIGLQVGYSVLAFPATIAVDYLQ
jgi:hypothetical protein